MVVKAKGILDFELDDLTKKHRSQSSWKRVAIIKTDCDLIHYYSWFLKKRFNLNLNNPIRSTHVSFISDKLEEKIFREAASIFNERDIKFYYEISPQSNGKHWWLRVHSPEAESIRLFCGLSKTPYFDFHITLGYASDKNLEHSQYIFEQCKRFKLISDKKIELDKIKIFEYA